MDWGVDGHGQEWMDTMLKQPTALQTPCCLVLSWELGVQALSLKPGGPWDGGNPRDQVRRECLTGLHGRGVSTGGFCFLHSPVLIFSSLPRVSSCSFPSQPMKALLSLQGPPGCPLRACGQSEIYGGAEARRENGEHISATNCCFQGSFHSTGREENSSDRNYFIIVGNFITMQYQPS